MTSIGVPPGGGGLRWGGQVQPGRAKLNRPSFLGRRWCVGMDDRQQLVLHSGKRLSGGNEQLGTPGALRLGRRVATRLLANALDLGLVRLDKCRRSAGGSGGYGLCIEPGEQALGRRPCLRRLEQAFVNDAAQGVVGVR
jgi:hypothetical protein